MLGLVLCLVVIVASFLMFGWALRLSFFGTLYAISLLQMLLFEVQERRDETGECGPSARAEGRQQAHVRKAVSARRWLTGVRLPANVARA